MLYTPAGAKLQRVSSPVECRAEIVLFEWFVRARDIGEADRKAV